MEKDDIKDVENLEKVDFLEKKDAVTEPEAAENAEAELPVVKSDAAEKQQDAEDVEPEGNAEDTEREEDSEGENTAEAKESGEGEESGDSEAKADAETEEVDIEMSPEDAFFASVLAGMCYVSFYDWQEQHDVLDAKKKQSLFRKNEKLLKLVISNAKFSKAFGEFVKKQGEEAEKAGCELEKPKNYRAFSEKLLKEFIVFKEDGLQTEFWLGSENKKGYIARKFEQTGIELASDYIYTLLYVIEKTKSSVRNDDKALKEIGASLGMDEESVEKTIFYHRKKQGKNWNRITLGVVALFVLLVGWCVFLGVRHYKMMKAFRSFDLSKLSQEEFIFQTIEFKKFVPYGTNGNFSVVGSITLNSLSAIVNELQIYYVSGRADIMFRHLDEKHLTMNEENSDYDKKILRLDYHPDSSGTSPFDVEVAINDKDIYQVYKKKSKEVLGMDFVKADKAPNEVVDDARKKLTAEFKKQLQTELADPEKLKNAELYQDFLKQFTKMVSAVSDWEQVEIDFGGQ